MDAYSQWLDHEAQAERWLESLPVCSICGEPIQDEYYYQIGDQNICEYCLQDYRVSNEMI